MVLNYILVGCPCLIQTLTSLCSLRPDFGRNADWLLESTEVESAYCSSGYFREWSAVGGVKDRFCCLFLLFHGLIVGKYALIRAMEILKFRWLFISYIFSGFALFTELMWVYRRVTMCLLIYQQTSANQSTVHLKSGFIWKFSREWLFWTAYVSGRSLQKKPQSPTVKY